jgi:hypothetical protein
MFSSLFQKIRKKAWSKLVHFTRNTSFYPIIYPSWWHSLFAFSHPYSEHNYFTAIPNRGAGIGHQMANWIAGYWFSKQFHLNFAHTSFSSPKWETLLGFGDTHPHTEMLIQTQGYKRIKLPLFDEYNTKELQRIQNIIDSYANQKVVFVAEQDQFYQDHCGVEDDIKRFFHSSTARAKDVLTFDPSNFNIAIHVRRGDITIGQLNKHPNLIIRWQENDYFINVLTKVLENITTDKKIQIYLFSQGKKEDFQEFHKFDNITYCLDMNAQDSFMHMVFADLLITSKSSFSYKPALLSNGIKICPKNFWHSYPQRVDWILAEESGKFEIQQLEVNNV